MTINVIGLGGAGANLLVGVKDMLSETMILDGHPDVNMFHVDTSAANKSVSAQVGASFYQVKSTTIGNKDLQGSGGVRSANVKETVISIREFVNDNMDVINEDSMNILISSASGGSGSILSPLLKKQLMELDIPAVVVLIGDSRSLSYAINTSDTLKTFHGIAKSKDAAISMVYLDNLDEPEEDVNMYVCEFCSILVLFYNSKNLDMDPADIASFMDPTKRRPKINIPSGIYDIIIDAGTSSVERMVKNSEVSPIISCRRLNADEVSETPALDDKRGSVYKELADEFKEGAFPILMYSQTNLSMSKLDKLEATINRLNIEVEQTDVETDIDEFGLHL